MLRVLLRSTRRIRRTSQNTTWLKRVLSSAALSPICTKLHPICVPSRPATASGDPAVRLLGTVRGRHSAIEQPSRTAWVVPVRARRERFGKIVKWTGLTSNKKGQPWRELSYGICI